MKFTPPKTNIEPENGRLEIIGDSLTWNLTIRTLGEPAVRLGELNPFF